ncbi:hypothetical protein GCM10010531_17180 [Blastococcus jejuensis]|uniref:Uncharacterized protein n=2 Tax=Blastococcus jejuensis TaxID=351224 RepID=A0ABP6P4I1_9ACTN
MLADAYGVRDYATLAALVGIALTAAKTVGPVTAGLARTVTGTYTAVLLAVPQAVFPLVNALSG